MSYDTFVLNVLLFTSFWQVTLVTIVSANQSVLTFKQEEYFIEEKSDTDIAIVVERSGNTNVNVFFQCDVSF